MRATGIIRRIDDLGRIVIPKEIRRSLRLTEGMPMELFVDDDGVTFKNTRRLTNNTKKPWRNYRCSQNRLQNEISRCGRVRENLRVHNQG